MRCATPQGQVSLMISVPLRKDFAWGKLGGKLVANDLYKAGKSTLCHSCILSCSEQDHICHLQY
jgi:hypothetical protein